MELKYRIFSAGGPLTSSGNALEKACKRAATFASAISPERIVSVTPTQPQINYAFVTVWYWSHERPIDPKVELEEFEQLGSERDDVEDVIRDTLDL